MYAESIPCTKSLEVELSPYFTKVGTITYEFGENQVYLEKYNQKRMRGQGYTHYMDLTLINSRIIISTNIRLNKYIQMPLQPLIGAT